MPTRRSPGPQGPVPGPQSDLRPAPTRTNCAVGPGRRGSARAVRVGTGVSPPGTRARAICSLLYGAAAGRRLHRLWAGVCRSAWLVPVRADSDHGRG